MKISLKGFILFFLLSIASLFLSCKNNVNSGSTGSTGPKLTKIWIGYIDSLWGDYPYAYAAEDTELHYVRIDDLTDEKGIFVSAEFSDGSRCYDVVSRGKGKLKSNFSEIPAGIDRTVTISYTENGITKTTELKGLSKASYEFHQKPVVLPAGTDGTQGKNATYVLFGDLPQGKAKPSDVSLGKLLYKAGNGGYRVGSDGNYYYDDEVYASGKVEPIKWCVIKKRSDGLSLLLSEKILCEYNQSLPGDNYEQSSIREFLIAPFEKSSFRNSYSFRKFAFTDSAYARIASVGIDNSAASTSDATETLKKSEKHLCGYLSDRIFLLSEKEVTTPEYGFKGYEVNDEARIRKFGVNGDSSQWALRSPSGEYQSYFIRYVDARGGANFARSASGKFFIVPALYITLN